MVIGVVTEAKDKNILQRIFRFLTVKIIETEENPFKLVVVTIPHTKQSLEKMDARHCVHLRKRIVKKARKHGEKCIGCPYAKQCNSRCSCNSFKK